VALALRPTPCYWDGHLLSQVVLTCITPKLAMKSQKRDESKPYSHPASDL